MRNNSISSFFVTSFEFIISDCVVSLGSFSERARGHVTAALTAFSLLCECSCLVYGSDNEFILW